jgi:hypothetical protein
MRGNLNDKLERLITLQEQTNIKLDKVAGLLAGNQLLTECVDPGGQVRTADECAEVVLEGFSAALCLMDELEQRNKQYQYQQSEFFLEELEETPNKRD